MKKSVGLLAAAFLVFTAFTASAYTFKTKNPDPIGVMGFYCKFPSNESSQVQKLVMTDKTEMFIMTIRNYSELMKNPMVPCTEVDDIDPDTKKLTPEYCNQIADTIVRNTKSNVILIGCFRKSEIYTTLLKLQASSTPDEKRAPGSPKPNGERESSL